MTREEVFRASGPTSGGVLHVKLGAKHDGTLVAADIELAYQAGAFPGSPAIPGCMTAFACYDVPNARAVGYDVVSNRPKCAAYRAPGAPLSAFAVESAMDELALQLKMDPIALRLKNAAKEGLSDLLKQLMMIKAPEPFSMAMVRGLHKPTYAKTSIVGMNPLVALMTNCSA